MWVSGVNPYLLAQPIQTCMSGETYYTVQHLHWCGLSGHTVIPRAQDAFLENSANRKCTKRGHYSETLFTWRCVTNSVMFLHMSGI